MQISKASGMHYPFSSPDPPPPPPFPSPPPPFPPPQDLSSSTPCCSWSRLSDLANLQAGQLAGAEDFLARHLWPAWRCQGWTGSPPSVDPKDTIPVTQAQMKAAGLDGAGQSCILAPEGSEVHGIALTSLASAVGTVVVCKLLGVEGGCWQGGVCWNACGPSSACHVVAQFAGFIPM